jgi:hypothetical protein
MWDVFRVPILVTEEGEAVPPLSLKGLPLPVVVCHDGKRYFSCISPAKNGWRSRVILVGWAFGRFCPNARNYVWLDINVAVQPRQCILASDGTLTLGELFTCPITDSVVRPKGLTVLREAGYNILASKEAEI